MDWSKAKSILIIILIITNLVLGGVWIMSLDPGDGTRTDEFVSFALEKLEAYGIHFETELPMTEPVLQSLYAETKRLDPAAIKRDFFNDEAEEVYEPEIGYVLKKGTERLEIWKGTTLYYTNSSTEAKYQPGSVEEAQAIVEEFFQARKFELREWSLEYGRQEGDRFHLYYANRIMGVCLERSLLNVVVSKSGVTQMEWSTLTVSESGGEKLYTNSAPKAVLTMLTMPQLIGKTVRSIELCYYLKTEGVGVQNQELRVFKGKTVPAWRVFFTDGTEVILDSE